MTVICRFCLLVSTITFAASTCSLADWTGVNVILEDTTSLWDSDGSQREASINQIILQLEEKTEAELRVGAAIGHASIRSNNVNGPSDVQKFDASFIGLYLRQPLQFGEFFSTEATLAYRYHTGVGNSETDPNEISWHQTKLTLAAGAKFGPIRIRPFITWQSVDGDVESETGREIFEADDPVSTGIELDYFVEPYAYIRFSVTNGNDESFSLSFAKVY